MVSQKTLAKLRFIPAYAGNATVCPSRRRAKPVHPRIRGERFLKFAAHLNSHGSSPHTRGTRRFCGSERYVCRFIPAYAGNVRPAAGPGQEVPVHPRIRGERGGADRDGGRRRRFIPAYAGNAVRTLKIKDPFAVHPRIRGERILWSSQYAAVLGSSPHTRGTRHADTRDGLYPAVHPRIRGERI